MLKKTENIISPIIDSYCAAVNKASKKCNACAFLSGSHALSILYDSPKISNVIEFIISSKDGFNKFNFWQELCKYIVVNQEIKSSDNEYFIISNDFVIECHIVKDLSHIPDSCSLNIDRLYYDLDKKEFTNPLTDDVLKIESLIPKNEWRVSDLIHLIARYSDFKDAEIKDDLSSINIYDLKPSMESSQDLIAKILLSLFPGKCMSKICSVIGGKQWLIDNLINTAIELNIPIKEDSGEILNSTKLEVLDVYGEFFGSKNRIEDVSQSQARLSTNLRLIFDTSDIDLHLPYIQHIKSRLKKWQSIEPIRPEKNMISWLPLSNEVQIVEKTNFTKQEITQSSPYPPTICNPKECDPPCCCCKTLDIISYAGVRCHDKVVISCDEHGDGPITGSQFPPTCDLCRSTCKDIIADTAGLTPPGGITCSNLSSQSWWSFSTNPCHCWCHDWKSQPNNSPCSLTCVTCGEKCSSSVNIEPSSVGDCAFQLSVKASEGCCGESPLIDFMFVIDYSSSMSGSITDIKNKIHILVSELLKTGSILRAGLIVYGASSLSYEPTLILDFNPDIDVFIDKLDSVSVGGNGAEYDLESLLMASELHSWLGISKYIMIICDSKTQTRNGVTKEHVVSSCYPGGITVYVVDTNNSSDRLFISNQTDGKRYNISEDFSVIFNDLDITTFPSSCECLDNQYTPVYRDLPECIDSETGLPKNDAPSYCTSIEIPRCYEGEICEEKCSLPYALYACGESIVIDPHEIGMACCSEVGYGCDCAEPPPGQECCGPSDEKNGFYCTDICDPVTGQTMSWLTSLQLAQQYVWCECFNKASYLDAIPSDPSKVCKGCCCPDETLKPGDIWYPCYLLSEGLSDHPEWLDYLNRGQCCDTPREQKDHCCGLCIWLNDGKNGFNKYCKDVIDELTRIAYENCNAPPIVVPEWDCPEADCSNSDECIIPGSDSRSCSQTRTGNSSIKHPKTLILNNGIGLIAYEYSDGNGNYSIEISQFKTSVKSKIISNRTFNYGRLQNTNKWSSNPIINQFATAKLYYYEDIPYRLINGISTGPTGEWKDSIAFVSGPLRNKCFPLALVPGTSSPIGADSIGNFILFFIPDGLSLSENFTSADDQYNIQWFLVDKEDTGLIGSLTDNTSPAKDFDLTTDEVNTKLKSITHLYNGSSVPVAYPQISVARNFQQTSENAQFVYLTYQAMEDGLWNVYLRQLRLSEYDKNEQIITDSNVPTLVSVDDLSLDEIICRIICVDDSCTEITNNFSINRTIVMEAILPDGREILNKRMPVGEYWGQICPGQKQTDFPKRKVFIKLGQYAVTDKCPDQFEYDEIFYQWQVGEEYPVKIDIDDNILYLSLKKSGGYAVPIGVYTSPIKKGTVYIYSSSISATWYQQAHINGEVQWYVMSDTPLEVLEVYRGFDIGEPVLLTHTETGHATHPDVVINYNNDVFVVYEAIRSGIPQIVLKGTATPSSSLPAGVINPKNPDETLKPFLKSSDFSYEQQITTTGMNQLPNMFLDLNDVVHLVWQSNRDTDWEIYYGCSDQSFINHRITESKGKSLRPNITGDEFGNLFVTWHDNRFGNYEIMLAYHKTNRILPYSQQDPYWAGVRNDYIHYQNSVPITLVNNSDNVICLTNLLVYFQVDRFGQSNAFYIDMNEWPFAFEFPNDTILSNTVWSNEFYPEYRSSIPANSIYYSPEIDTATSEIVYRFNLKIEDDEYVVIPTTIYISFRASDISNDPQSDIQWSDWIDITGRTNEWIHAQNENTFYYPLDPTEGPIGGSVPISEVKGRYKQSRILVWNIGTIPTSLIVESVSSFKACLNPGEELIVNLNLMPQIRVTVDGSEKTRIPLPEVFKQNNTYFISPKGIIENDIIYSFNQQEVTVSCFDCVRDSRPWDQVSCSFSFETLNENLIRHLKFRISFYADKEKLHLISQYNLEPNSLDLNYIDIPSNNAEWDETGLLVGVDSSVQIIFYPPLSPETGMLCGIKYYVEVEKTSIDEHDNISNQIIVNESWLCDCNSERWNRFSPNIQQINETYRWNSSAFGYNDTRMTESNGNNFKPIIKLRNNLQGIILYQTDQSSKTGNTEYDNAKYKVNACVFEYVPDYTMYSSGAQVAVSPVADIYPRSDINILDSDSKHLYGDNTSFQIDMYDNLFIVAENPPITTDGSQQFARVHRCGLQNLNFDFDWTIPPSQPQPSPIIAEPCVPRISCYLSEEDPTISHLVKKISVLPKDIKYYVYKYNKQIAVVGKCDISIIIVGAPEIVAFRIRNNPKDQWSKWLAFEPESGDYTIEFKLPHGYYLSPTSGVKHIYIQFATYTGLAVSVVYDIIADYDKVNFELNMYKSVPGIDPSVTVLPDVSNQIFVESNRLPVYDHKFPVASLYCTVSDNMITTNTTNHFYIEIIPSEEYLLKLKQYKDITDPSSAPTFDFIYQGPLDQFNLPTYYVNSNGRDVFRSFLTYGKEDFVIWKDGLAYILVNFSEDCSSLPMINPDQPPSERGSMLALNTEGYNWILNQKSSSSEQVIIDINAVDIVDPWESERDQYGRIKFKVVLRSDDPYFIFGDPNYELNSNE